MYLKKNYLAEGGDSFGAKKITEKAKGLGICPSFSGNVSETQFHQCPIPMYFCG